MFSLSLSNATKNITAPRFQLTRYYRYGEMDNCEEFWEDFYKSIENHTGKPLPTRRSKSGSKSENDIEDIETKKKKKGQFLSSLKTKCEHFLTKTTENEEENSVSSFAIQVFGINEKGQTASITIENYEPFFYLRVGNHWTKDNAQELLRDLQKKLYGNHSKSLLKAELVEYNKLYGFSANNKDQFVKLTFQNVSSMNKTKSLWYRYLTEKEKKKAKNSNFKRRGKK